MTSIKEACGSCNGSYKTRGEQGVNPAPLSAEVVGSSCCPGTICEQATLSHCLNTIYKSKGRETQDQTYLICLAG